MFDQRFNRRNIIAHAALDDMNLQNAKTQEWLAFAAQLVHMVPAQRGSREASQTMRADDAAKQKIYQIFESLRLAAYFAALRNLLRALELPHLVQGVDVWRKPWGQGFLPARKPAD